MKTHHRRSGMWKMSKFVIIIYFYFTKYLSFTDTFLCAGCVDQANLTHHSRACFIPATVFVLFPGSQDSQSAASGIPAHNSRDPSCAGPPRWGQRWTQSSSPPCRPWGAPRTAASSSCRAVPWTATGGAPSWCPEVRHSISLVWSWFSVSQSTQICIDASWQI